MCNSINKIQKTKIFRWNLVWFILGLWIIVIGILWEIIFFNRDTININYNNLLISTIVLKYHWVGILLILLIIIILYEGEPKDILRKVLPAVIVSLIVLYIIKNLLAVLFSESYSKVTNKDFVITCSFFFSLFTVPKLSVWIKCVTGIFLILVGWSGIVNGIYYISTIISGVGTGLIGLSVITIPEKQKDVLAFGVIPAYRKYELSMMRHIVSAEFIKKELQKKNKIKVLDIGCGFGDLKYFCPPEVEMYGVEIDDERIEKCESLGYKMTKCDLENDRLPYPDNEFDVVVICHCLEHLVNPGFTLREADRVLCKGGLISIGVPLKFPILVWLAEFKHQIQTIIRGQQKTETCQFFTIKRFLQFLKQHLHNYKIIDVRGFRLISGKHYLPFEDWYWFFKLNVRLGKHFPYIAPEINVVMQKE